jgi:uncharacterized membrane protein
VTTLPDVPASASVLSLSPRVARPRLRTLDGVRGVALLLLIISHCLQLLPTWELSQVEYRAVNGFLFLTKVATPLFVWVFGMTMAYVYFDQLDQPAKFAQLKRRLWKRALLVFLSHQILVIVIETSNHSPFNQIIGRLLYVRLGFWIEVLNFYFVILLISPWLLRWWRNTPPLVRACVIPMPYLLGYLLAPTPVSPALAVIKDTITGSPGSDTFPVLQFSAFYLVGLTFGEFLFEKLPSRNYATVFRTSALIALECALVSFLWSGLSLKEYLKAIAADTYKFPVAPPYIFLGFAGIFIVTISCLWFFEVRQTRNVWTHIIELLGRHSLLTFVLQYVLLFTVYGLLFNVLNTLTFLETFVNALIILVLSLMTVWVWERIKQ